MNVTMNSVSLAAQANFSYGAQTAGAANGTSFPQMTENGNSISNSQLNQLILSLINLLIAQLQDNLNQQNQDSNSCCCSHGITSESEKDNVTNDNLVTNQQLQQQVADGITESSVFNTAVGSDQPGPIRPGESIEVEFTAKPGDHISFASMYAPTNDYFFGAEDGGIPVYDANGNPVSGDVTDAVHLWDSGTEADEQPFEGQFQTMDRTAQIVAAPNTGPADPLSQVRRVNGAFGLPATSELVKAEIIHKGGDKFVFRLTNTSDQTVDASPNSPGLFVVHDSNINPLYTEGQLDRGWGLEGIAEDGNPASIASFYNSLLGEGDKTSTGQGH